MKVTKKILPKSIIELTIEKNRKETEKYKKKAFEYIRKNIDIKGFRKGATIPEDIIIKECGEEYINEIIVNLAMDDVYVKILKKENIIPIAAGEIKEIVSISPLKVLVNVEILPKVEINKKYKKIKLKREKIEVSENEVTDRIKKIEEKFTTFKEVEDKSKKAEIGDRVIVDIDELDGEKIIEENSMKDFSLVLGSSTMIPNFENSIVGVKKGDELKFPVKFPKDYHNSDYANKKVFFKVKVKKIEKALKPEFNEKFIELLRGEKTNIEGFKKIIKKEIEIEKEEKIRGKEEGLLFEELFKITKIEVGDKMLEEEMKYTYDDIKSDVESNKMKMKYYLEYIKMSEDEFKEKKVKLLALNKIKCRLILAELLELEKTEITDDEINLKIEEIISNFNVEKAREKLKEIYVPGNKHYEELRLRTMEKKLIDSFFV